MFEIDVTSFTGGDPDQVARLRVFVAVLSAQLEFYHVTLSDDGATMRFERQP